MIGICRARPRKPQTWTSWKRTLGQKMRRVSPAQARLILAEHRARGVGIGDKKIRELTGGYSSQAIDAVVIRKLAERAGSLRGMLGCILPSGNRAEFPMLDEELRRRGIKLFVTELRGGGRVYQIADHDLKRLPTDDKGPYIGNDVSGHSIHVIDSTWLAEERVR